MTNTTGTQTITAEQRSTVGGILEFHGYASVDDAREDMVSFGCHGCGSIAFVTATTEDERRMQASLVGWYCPNVLCEGYDDFVL